MDPALGTYPFGVPLRAVVQMDRTPKRVFVLGVYASAVHARWKSPEGETLIRALAVASEPSIFWDGVGADDIIASIPIPDAAGTLVPADERLNGPSGRALDQDFLAPIDVDRSQTWLCDLVPHTCLNPAQKTALEREYEPRRETLGLPEVDLPDVPDTFADEARRTQVLTEIRAARPQILVLLGDQPIRHFLSAYDGRWKRLADFGKTRETYGRLHPTNLDGIELTVLPLAHPRQTSGLGRHSSEWKDLHTAWKHQSSPVASPG
ncbi:MAG: hypothetical protein WBM26_10430 [Polyangiales bacterium]